MIPWEKLDTARIPGTEDELRLMRRGKEFSIMLGTNELMNSRLSGSEAALATLAAKKIESVAKPHMLVGGLGMTNQQTIALLFPAVLYQAGHGHADDPARPPDPRPPHPDQFPADARSYRIDAGSLPGDLAFGGPPMTAARAAR